LSTRAIKKDSHTLSAAVSKTGQRKLSPLSIIASRSHV
jgi:hypothetical protein